MNSRGERFGRREESGSLTAELVLLTPIIVVFALLAVGLGRYELAREAVVGSARAAAEAAAVAASASQAQAAASTSASPGVSDLGNGCTSLQVNTNTSQFSPGGSVSVTVTCHISFADIFVPGVPGSTTVTAVESAPIDPYRSVQ
jgi:Flp pilus assembly protein TadG